MQNSSFERKNSFLGKLFSGAGVGYGEKKNSGNTVGGEKMDTSNMNGGREGTTKKPKIATFSAQFPPPELMELSNPIYTALIRKPKQAKEDALHTPQNEIDGTKFQYTASPTPLSHHQGPNGNFVMYEKQAAETNNTNISDTAPSDDYKKSVSIYGGYHPPNHKISTSQNNDTSSYGYASVGSINIIGGSTAVPQLYQKQLPPPPISSMGPQRHITPMSSNVYNSHENYYSNPPPPLPYRPPPPNPYLMQQQHPSNKHSSGSPITTRVAMPHQYQPHLRLPPTSTQNQPYTYMNTSSSPTYESVTRQMKTSKSPPQSRSLFSNSNKENNNNSILCESSNHRHSNNNKSGIPRNVRFADETGSSVASSSADVTLTPI